MKKYIFTALFICGLIAKSFAQDPQYSQFYAAPLHVSPAFAGSALGLRAIANYRNQWPGLDAQFTTYSVSVDHYFRRIKSGVGLVVTNDIQSFGGLRNTDIGAQYAYQLELTRELAFRAGLQASYVQRSSGYFNMTFGNQFNNGGFVGGPSGEPLGDATIGYVDLSAGGLLFSRRYYIGYSTHHMNRPNQSFYNSTVDGTRLPIKHTLTAGMVIPLNDKTKRGLQQGYFDRGISLSPALLFKKQGPFDQLDAGLYFTYEPLVFGTWYRGLPIKRFAPEYPNNDAVILLIGGRLSGFSIGYSYDITISRLTPNSGGAHEISLTYEFMDPKSGHNPFRRGRALPCPRF